MCPESNKKSRLLNFGRQGRDVRAAQEGLQGRVQHRIRTLLANDARMIPNLKQRDTVIDTAKKLSIPLQISAIEGGATDGGAIHLHRIGVPTVVLSVPTRHIHSHNALLRRDDFDHTVELATALVQALDKEAVAMLTSTGVGL